MNFNKKEKINIFNLLISISLLIIFLVLIININNLNNYKFINEKALAINLANDEDLQGYIPLNKIIISSEEFNWKFTYIVQPWDTLSKIAYKFWTSISTIKSVNKLKNDIIRPWQKLIITEEEWIFYELPKNITLKEFAKKYKLDLEKLKQINYFIEDDILLQKWDEIFIPITEKEAIKKWLIKPTNTILTKRNNNIYWKKQQKKQFYSQRTTLPRSALWRNIIAKRYYAPDITNWFYRWHCTWYVAIKKFPYITKNRQKKLWNWNAKDWYKNAAKAWYPVWKTPKVGSIVVIKYWWRYWRNYWHVAIVLQIDWKNKRLLVEEMNAVWRFIVTRRWIPMDNKIIWYIYL